MPSLLSTGLKTDVARRVLGSVGVSAYVFGAATGLPYPRFLGLRSAAERALRRNDLEDAETLAREFLSLASRYEEDWSYGNAIHHGHLILGRVELKRNRLGPAIEELHEAGKTRGSPQLKAFGPNMLLARELLELGETQAVIKYLDLCREFWDASAFLALKGRHPLDEWRETVQRGEIPDFGANLVF